VNRGFLCILYRSEGAEAAIHGRTPPAVWKRCLLIAAKTFRFNNPDAALHVLDIHDQLSEGEKEVLRRLAHLEEASSLERWGFGCDTYNKIIALRHSPFDQACVIDLDMLFTGDVRDVFDEVRGDLGVLHYPNYRRTRNRINSGVLVMHRRTALDVLDRQRARLGPGMTEEDLIDHCMSEGLVSVSRIPDVYGKSKQMWWAKTPADLTPSCASEWTGALSVDWSPTRPVFQLGAQRVLAWHFSSAKERMVSDPLAIRYLERIDRCLR
jgi:hypothetical protein